MMERFELVDADGAVLDTVTVADGGITYRTGEAESLVETRVRLIPDVGAMARSLDGWSNGYLAMRRVDGAGE